MTVSHLRFSCVPIRSTYLIDQADLVACHHFAFLFTQDVLAAAKPGATVLLNAPYPPEEVWDVLPERVQRAIIDKLLKVHVIDAHRVAGELGLRGRINTVMPPRAAGERAVGGGGGGGAADGGAEGGVERHAGRALGALRGRGDLRGAH